MKQKKQPIFNVHLDKEEQELSDALDQSIDLGTLKSVDNLEEELDFAKAAAKNFIHQEETVTLHLSSNDLALLKQRAIKKGLPYDIFIVGVLHQYLTGQFT